LTAAAPQRSTHRALALLLLALITWCCGPERGEPGPEQGKLIVIGLDAASWKVIDPMIARGDLPQLAALIDRGCRAPLQTLYPTISSMIWTSMATGVPAEMHGRDYTITRIKNRYRYSKQTGARLAYPALWQCADHLGLRSLTVNWYSANAPWSPVRSRVLADLIEGDRPIQVRMPPFELPGLAFTMPDQQTLAVELGLPAEAGSSDRSRPKLSRELEALRWRYAADEYMRQAAERLTFDGETGQPDLALLFFKHLDGVQHKFWAFMDQATFPWIDDDERERYGGVVEAYYRYYDRVVGRFIERAEPGTTFILLSDHGMEPIRAQDGRSVPRDLTVKQNMSLFRPGDMAVLLETLGLLRRDDQGQILWSQTRVFTHRDKGLTWEMGFCLNVAGREPEGIVETGEYQNLLQETAERLGRISAVDGSGPLFPEVTVRPNHQAAEILVRVNAALPLETLFDVEGRQWRLRDLVERYDMTGGHQFAPDGIFIAAGPGIRQGVRLDSATIYDVAPTICMLAGMPLARDYAGQPLTAILDEQRRAAWAPAYLDSYRDVVPGFAEGRPAAGDADLMPLDEQAEERLRSLGYIR